MSACPRHQPCLGVSASVRIDFVVRYDGLRASAQQKNQEEHGRWHSQQPENDVANRAGLIPVAIGFSVGASSHVLWQAKANRVPRACDGDARGTLWNSRSRVCEPSLR